jgi:hypothetical protein
VRDRRQRRRSRNLECAARRRLARRLKTGTDEARAVVRLLTALGVCVSGRRGAERSERSEDGTPAARDPSEARGTPSGAPIQPPRLPPTTSCAPTITPTTSPSPSRTARTTTAPTSSSRSSSPRVFYDRKLRRVRDLPYGAPGSPWSWRSDASIARSVAR